MPGREGEGNACRPGFSPAYIDFRAQGSVRAAPLGTKR
jgi:hypothetical protein